MDVVYISGPYRPKRWNPLAQLSNIIRARRAAREVWQRGDYAICPHVNSAFYKLPAHTRLDGNLELLKRCDIMVIIDQWQTSEDSWNELAAAQRLNIPVYTWENYEVRGVLPDENLRVALRHRAARVAGLEQRG